MENLKGITTRKTNFADWYTDVINQAKLVMYSSIKGEMIFRPNGWMLWTQIQNELDKRFAKYGVLNVALPTFIKYSEFNKESKHISGFAPEVFMVTHKGETKLDDPYVIRPTSEVLFCEYFKKVLNSYNDLPIKLNQWCSVFRAEKNTRPFLRTTEFFWQEMHCIFSNEKDAREYALNIIDEYYDFVTKFLLIPCIKGEKTIGERFAGAENTYTIEALMQDEQVLQCGTSHYLGTNFAKAYDIVYQDKTNKKQLVHQTSHGISTRLLGALIMSHSDDHGLVLPFLIAPYQIAILGINCDKDHNVSTMIDNLSTKLSISYRIKIDKSNKGLGYKLSQQEVLGVPISIIIGPQDLAKKQVMIFRRDTSSKEFIAIDKLEKHLVELIKQYQNNLLSKAQDNLNKHIYKINTLEEFKKTLKTPGFILAPWGGDEKDEKKLKQEYGITPRCVHSKIKDSSTKCFYTKNKAQYLVYFGRAY